MKKQNIITIILFIYGIFLSNVYAQPSDPIERVYYTYLKTEGFVYFDGFDFNNFNHLTYPSLQEMLDITYNELVMNYKSSSKSFVFLHH